MLALDDAVVLRPLAAERTLRGLVAGGTAYAVWTFRNEKPDLRHAFEENLPLLDPIANRLTTLRTVALTLNVAVVVYIVLTKRMFGIRGGAAAHAEQHCSDAILELHQAAEPTGRRH